MSNLNQFNKKHIQQHTLHVFGFKPVDIPNVPATIILTNKIKVIHQYMPI